MPKDYPGPEKYADPPSATFKYYITTHALNAFRLHHPDADRKLLSSVLDTCQLVPAEIAAVLAGRVNVDHASLYYLPPDFLGMFVLQGHVVITYLRFQQSQQDFCRKHYG